MIDGVEADAKFANLQWVFFLHATVRRLDTGPIIVHEDGVILGVESRSLKVLQGVLHQFLYAIDILPRVKKKCHISCSCVVGVLNEFLQ